MSPLRPTAGGADLRALLEALISVGSFNPDLVPGGAGEGELSGVVGRWLAEHGVQVTYQEVAPGRRNVIGRVAGSGGGRSCSTPISTRSAPTPCPTPCDR